MILLRVLNAIGKISHRAYCKIVKKSIIKGDWSIDGNNIIIGAIIVYIVYIVIKILYY